MTITVKQPDSFPAAIRELEALMQPDVVFRGHTSIDHRLRTTYERFRTIEHEAWDTSIHGMVRAFHDGLVRTGQRVIRSRSLLDWLEYARHHNLPAPLLDFTWSPWVALFFAYNGISPPRTPEESPAKSIVYALDLKVLAAHWAKRHSALSDNYAEYYWSFLRGDAEPFEKELPGNEIRLIRSPSRHTTRMHRQLGVFLYCTLYYGMSEVTDLEDYLDRRVDDDGLEDAMRPVLTKIVLPHEWAGDALCYLERAGISGAYLFNSPEGVAMDIVNSKHFITVVGRLRNDGNPHAPPDR